MPVSRNVVNVKGSLQRSFCCVVVLGTMVVRESLMCLIRYPSLQPQSYWAIHRISKDLYTFR